MSVRAQLILAMILLGAAFGAGYWSAYQRHSAGPLAQYNTLKDERHVVPSRRAPTRSSAPVTVSDGQTQRRWHQMVHTAIPIEAPQTQPLVGEIAPTKTEFGELSFDLGDSTLTFDPRTPEHATVERTARCFAAFVTLELPRNIKSSLTEARLFRIECDAEAGSAIDPINEVANVTWEVRTLAPVRQSERAVAVDQSVGFGAAFGGWHNTDPCVTYSVLRLGRLRLPSAMADAGGHLGAGIQARIWRPFHTGAFCAWDLANDFTRSVRVTATANF